MRYKDEIEVWLSIAEKAALLAGSYLLNPEQQSKNINSDAGRDIKIAADVESENIILNFLKENSGFSILSEESGMIQRNDRRFTWIIDPLDGSLNYLRGIPSCCVSIGLWHEQSPILGVVNDFHHSELYTGIAGKGAWINGVKIGISSVSEKKRALLCTGFPVNTDFSTESLMSFIQRVQGYKKVRILRSAVLSLVYIASGRADAYVQDDIMLWDVAGGIAIASGSGCKCEINDGSHPNAFRVTVSNGNFDVN